MHRSFALLLRFVVATVPLAAVSLAAGGCGPNRANTQVIILVRLGDGTGTDLSITASAVGGRISEQDGAVDWDPSPQSWTLQRECGQPPLPFSISLSPLDHDATRVFHVEVTARTGATSPAMYSFALTGAYVAGETRYITVDLLSCQASTPQCYDPMSGTCNTPCSGPMGMCVCPLVPGEMFAPFDLDAGMPVDASCSS